MHNSGAAAVQNSSVEQSIPNEVVLKVKRWRIGSLSMGVALFLSGIFLLVSQWNGAEVWDLALLWWPVIFILLGAELLVYLFVARSSDGKVYYDLFSIFFVGCLGMLCLLLATLSSLGITQELRHYVSATERTVNLPELQAAVGTETSRLIIQTNRPHLIQLDQMNTNNVHAVSTYHTSASALDEDYVQSALILKEIGDTLYLFVKDPPQKTTFRAGYDRVEVTVIVPEGLTAEIRDSSGYRY